MDFYFVFMLTKLSPVLFLAFYFQRDYHLFYYLQVYEGLLPANRWWNVRQIFQNQPKWLKNINAIFKSAQGA